MLSRIIGGGLLKLAEVYSRATNFIDNIERSYLRTLEELRAREEEILSRDELKPSEIIELIGIRASIKLITEELGIPYDPSIEEIFDIMELINRKQEAELAV
ncbi:MAG: hypothetical protein DRO40_01245 [Thermoprotei archaeon]|nr:MAG: hypothetical protein DRO40_01245 [Thermoprotei archaeon]